VFSIFVGFLNLEFLSYVLVCYTNLLFIHGPLSQKAIFEELFCKYEGGGFKYNFEKKVMKTIGS
jgi:hypothetical protein